MLRRGAPAGARSRERTMRRPLAVAAGSLVLSAAAGWLVVGHLLYKVPIGLDESAFLWGAPLQRLAEWFRPHLEHAVSGGVLLLLALVAIGALAFLFVRAAVRARATAPDPGRRKLLLGAGSG